MSEPQRHQRKPAIDVTGVVKRFGAKTALGGVSLTADREIFGLLGANGAGKSTLMKAILGLHRPDEGEIRVCGLRAGYENAEVKRLVGYLPEELDLYERLTGQEFLEFMAGLRGIKAEDEIDSGLATFELTEARQKLIGGYSLGMRKKIGIIAALLGSPPLLLLDEPLNGLDTLSMRKLRLLLEERAAAGATVVLSSHVMSFVERICGRMVILRDGLVAAEGPPASLRQTAQLNAAPFEDVFLHYALPQNAADLPK